MSVQDLADRYGKPLIVLNLVKGAEKRPRESILQSEFANAISYINKGVSSFPWVQTPWALVRVKPLPCCRPGSNEKLCVILCCQVNHPFCSDLEAMRVLTLLP